MKKLLIAEDDFYMRDIYSNVFLKSNYEVAVAIDGADAIDKIKNNFYDIILLDIMMPKFSGKDVLIKLRSLEYPVNKTPVFIITNLGQQNVIDELFKIGIDGFIIKSEITPQQLTSRIDSFFLSK